jgi:hypothetical protein
MSLVQLCCNIVIMVMMSHRYCAMRFDLIYPTDTMGFKSTMRRVTITSKIERDAVRDTTIVQCVCKGEEGFQGFRVLAKVLLEVEIVV